MLDSIHSLLFSIALLGIFILAQLAVRQIRGKHGQAQGAPFEIFVPENRYLFVSSAKHINEVDTAPDSVLSLQAAAKQACYVTILSIPRAILSLAIDATTKVHDAQIRLVRQERD
ncbi:MAG: hypothetical protein Q9194_002113 [Teloschistes cf. exilis]